MIMTHIFRSSLRLPVDIQEVFSFFADAANLEKVTPPELHFSILTPPPIEIRKGQLIDYRLRLFGIPFRWRAMISKWEPPFQFIDEQVRGPYRLWIHTHRFSQENGLTKITDTVHYRLPLWPFGEIAYPLILALLRRIFSFRNNAIRRFLMRQSSSV